MYIEYTLWKIDEHAERYSFRKSRIEIHNFRIFNIVQLDVEVKILLNLT